MSISGSQIVQDALTACGAYGIGDNLADADAELVLRRLNRMIEGWGTTADCLYEIALDTKTLTAGVASYSAITFAAAVRPVSIDSCYVTLSGVDYPVGIIGNQEYQGYQYKSSVGTPYALYPAATSSDWTLYFYPTPDVAYVATLAVRRLLTSSQIALSTTFTGPPGYERALVDNLAVDIAPSFGKQADPTTVKSAALSLGDLRRANYQPTLMDQPGERTTIFGG